MKEWPRKNFFLQGEKVSPRFTNIPEYDLHPRSELVKAVHQFALAHMKKHFYIEHITGGETKGLSGDPVYKVISYPDHKFEQREVGQISTDAGAQPF